MARLPGLCGLMIAIAATGCWPSAVPAQPMGYQGEGSHSSNPGLSGDTHLSGEGETGPPPVLVTSDRLLAGPPPDKGLPDGPLRPAPSAQPAPFFETDWSISLRGSYEHRTDNSRFVASVVPEFALLHTGRRSTITLRGTTELSADDDGSRQMRNAEGSVDVTYRIDRATEASLAATGRLSREHPLDPGVDDSVAATPHEIDATVAAGLARQFNRLGIEARGEIARHHETDTALVGGAKRSGKPSSFWEVGAGLRAGFDLTPILTPSIEADVTRTRYDAAPESTGVRRDGWEYVIRGGLAANWRDVITTEASVGYGMRTFDAGSIADVHSALYALNLTYTPNGALAVGAGLSSTIEAGDPDAGDGTATVYEANVDASYGVNSLLTLRGALSGSVTRPRGDGLNSYGYTAGAGANLAINKRTDLTLDYTYEFSHDPPDPDEHAHGVTLGLTFSQ